MYYVINYFILNFILSIILLFLNRNSCFFMNIEINYIVGFRYMYILLNVVFIGKIDKKRMYILKIIFNYL